MRTGAASYTHWTSGVGSLGDTLLSLCEPWAHALRKGCSPTRRLLSSRTDRDSPSILACALYHMFTGRSQHPLLAKDFILHRLRWPSVASEPRPEDLQLYKIGQRVRPVPKTPIFSSDLDFQSPIKYRSSRCPSFSGAIGSSCPCHRHVATTLRQREAN